MEEGGKGLVEMDGIEDKSGDERLKAVLICIGTEIKESNKETKEEPDREDL